MYDADKKEADEKYMKQFEKIEYDPRANNVVTNGDLRTSNMANKWLENEHGPIPHHEWSVHPYFTLYLRTS